MCDWRLDWRMTLWQWRPQLSCLRCEVVSSGGAKSHVGLAAPINQYEPQGVCTGRVHLFLCVSVLICEYDSNHKK